MLFLLSLASADPSVLTGRYSMSSDPAAVEAAQQAELTRTLETIPALLRPIADHLLRPTLFYCKAYNMVVSGGSFSNQCDDKPALTRTIDGSAVPMQVGDINFVSHVSVDGDQILLTLEGEHGSRMTRYTATAAGMHVEITVTSPRLEKPMSWGIDYRRQ